MEAEKGPAKTTVCFNGGSMEVPYEVGGGLAEQGSSLLATRFRV